MKYLVFALLLAFGVQNASAQEVYNSSGKPAYKKKSKKKQGYDPDRLIVGGGLNGIYTSGFLSAGISPIVGYRLTKNWSAGVGLGYQYTQEAIARNPVTNKLSYVKWNVIYPSIWTRYFVFRNIFADVTFEYDFISERYPMYFNYSTNKYETVKTKLQTPCLLVGAGFKQPLGGRVFVFGQIMYDVLQTPYSPYEGRVFPRFGIVAGL
jgi:hypothetical protein